MSWSFAHRGHMGMPKGITEHSWNFADTTTQQPLGWFTPNQDYWKCLGLFMCNVMVICSLGPHGHVHGRDKYFCNLVPRAGNRPVICLLWIGMHDVYRTKPKLCVPESKICPLKNTGIFRCNPLSIEAAVLYNLLVCQITSPDGVEKFFTSKHSVSVMENPMIVVVYHLDTDDVAPFSADVPAPSNKWGSGWNCYGNLMTVRFHRGTNTLWLRLISILLVVMQSIFCNLKTHLC